MRSIVFGGCVLAPGGDLAPAVRVLTPDGRTVQNAGSSLMGGGSVAFVGSGIALVLGAGAGSRPVVRLRPARPRLDGDVVVTVLGLPIVPETTAFGALWLDPNTAVGVASAGERVVPAAALLSLSGLDLTAQALVLRGRLSPPLSVLAP